MNTVDIANERPTVSPIPAQGSALGFGAAMRPRRLKAGSLGVTGDAHMTQAFSLPEMIHDPPPGRCPGLG